MRHQLIHLMLFVFSISISLSGMGASENIDSLRQIIKHGPDKQKTSAYYRLAYSEKKGSQAKIYFDSSYFFYKLNPNDTDLMYYYGFKGMTFGKYKMFDEAIDLCKQSAQIAEKINALKDQSAMYNYLNNVYTVQHSYDSSIYYIQKAITIYNKLLKEKIEPEEFCLRKLGYGKYQLGKLLFLQGKYTSAIEYMYDGLRDYIKIEDYDGQAKIHNNIGNIFNFNKDYKRAYAEYLQCIKLSELSYNQEILNSVYTNIGSIFFNENNYDSALYFYDKSLANRLNDEEASLAIAGIYNNKGLIYKRLQKYDSSLNYFQRALDIQYQIDYKYGQASTKANMGLVYITMDKPQVAKKLLLESLDFSEGNKMGETTKEIYNGLYTIYSSQKNYKEALRYFELYVTYKDSINSIEVTTKINQYKEQFEAEQRDRKIDQLEQQALLDHLNQEKLKEVNRRRNTRSIFIGIAITLLLIIVIVVQRYFHLKQKAKSELLLINEEINQQKMVDLIKNQEVNSINSYMEGQERERNRIAAELHDRLGSLLSTVKLHFSTLERMWKKNYGESEGFTFALDLLDNSVAEVRSISHNLSKGVLMQFSLTEAVENLKDAINIAGRIQVKVIKVGPKHLLKPEIEIELFRVIQELITNAVKHSQAKEIFVQLIADNDGLNITVEDHGIGFDIKTVNSNGLGLKNLKSRVEAVGGDVHFESAVGKGTSVMIEIKNQA